MKIYALTQLGMRAASNTNAPDSVNWRVIFSLRKLGRATMDQLALDTGCSTEEIGGAIVTLKSRKLVVEL